MAAAVEDPSELAPKKSDAWTDLGLTLPIFVAYHLGVAFLPVRNAADPVTAELRSLASQDLLLYAALTLGIGVVFVLVLAALGKREVIRKRRFFLIALEGTLYAFLMRFIGGYVIGSLRLGPPGGNGLFTSVIMALGAGFYEEIAFRVILFGAGAFALKKVLGKGPRAFTLCVAWAIVSAMVFSGWHHVGALSAPFHLQTFVFRSVCALVLTIIYAFRGFAPAVWTHALYDVWVMVLR
jgi:hypothetical protein